MSKQIALGNGLFTTVDDADYELLNQRKWHAIKPPNPKWPTYAVSWPSRKILPRAKCQDRMHLLLMKPAKDQKVIHLDFDGLNNQRANLKAVSKGEARFHSRRGSNNTSGARGVSFSRTKKMQRRWRAFIFLDGKQKHIGHYASFDEAVDARKKAELEHYGPVAFNEASGDTPEDQPRVLNVTWFPPDVIHHLSDINVITRTGVCSACGPVRISNGGEGCGWKCKIKSKETKEKFRKRYNKARDLLRRPHLKFKKDHCERCGFIPDHLCQLDVHHKDYDAKNNAIENLETICSNCHRLETQKKRDSVFLGTDTRKWVGARNMPGLKKGGENANTSGVVGVGWVKANRKWEAHIGIDGISIRLGTFTNFDDAVAARKAAEQQHYTAA